MRLVRRGIANGQAMGQDGDGAIQSVSSEGTGMADERPDVSSPPKKQTKILKADYIKSNLFRVVVADGAFGGLTPRGNIHIDFWSERRAIPTHCEGLSPLSMTNRASPKSPARWPTSQP